MVSYPDDFWWECQGFKLQARCPNKTDLRFPLFNKNQWLINGASEWARLLTQWRKGWFRPPATKDKLETHSNRCFWILDVAIKLNTCQKRVFRTPILVKRVAPTFFGLFLLIFLFTMKYTILAPWIVICFRACLSSKWGMLLSYDLNFCFLASFLAKHYQFGSYSFVGFQTNRG